MGSEPESATYSSGQCWILNLLIKARDWTLILMDIRFIIAEPEHWELLNIILIAYMKRILLWIDLWKCFFLIFYFWSLSPDLLLPLILLEHWSFMTISVTVSTPSFSPLCQWLFLSLNPTIRNVGFLFVSQGNRAVLSLSSLSTANKITTSLVPSRCLS